ncbi:hypothetical protein F4861DRAFT_532618 [Xylaria intraflava]|nr:hypothetical protein F4861DRAFT_532618 [Xylaria intraflava]
MQTGRPRSNIDRFRAEITDAYELGLSIEEILASIASQGCTAKKRTLQRRIRLWGLENRKATHDYTAEILDQIQFLFYVRGYKDVSIQTTLRRAGFSISLRTVQRVRLQHGMKRRYATDEERNAAIQAAAYWLEYHAQTSSAVQSFGRAYLYEFIRTQAGIVVGKHRIYQYYKRRWPEHVRQRAQARMYHEGRFIVPGPNYLWCLDGYMKLQKMGFEIYAAIDAWSRRIIWIYVGPTACTAISTLKQFLRTMNEGRIRPLFTRADMGVETGLLAGAQGLLAQADGTAMAYEGPNGEQRIHHQGSLLASCHIWGSSKENQRIEMWWRVFRTGSSDRYVRLAEELSASNYLNVQDDRDLIACYAIYGSRLRTDIAEFVQLWNNHTIRRQKNRPHVVHGKPTELYESSEVNWGIPIEEGSNADKMLRTMYEPLEAVEIDAFYNEETDQWCRTQLAEMNFDEVLHTEEDHKRPYLQYYLELRRRVREHIASRALPHLKLTTHPTGGYDEYAQLVSYEA